MLKVITAAHTETQMDELLRHPDMAKAFSRDDLMDKLLGSEASPNAKQQLIYHMQAIKWYLNH